MVETIAPVVYERRSRYVTAIVLHALAATTTAATLGVVLGSVGMVIDAPWGTTGLVVLVGIAILYAARETFRLPIPLPNARRQVPEWWRTFFSPPLAATLYGAGLGIAFLTFLSYGTFAAVATGALVAGDPIVGAALCAPFGLARAAAIAAVGWRSQDPGMTVSALADTAATSTPRVVNALALAAVAGAAAAQIV